MNNLRWKNVLRRDEIQGHFRLIRIMWEVGEVGLGRGGYSTKLSLALVPRLFGWYRETKTSWFLTVLCLRIHKCRSYGGLFA